jgi:hypothetical protein
MDVTEAGRIGGTVAARNMTKTERTERARKAAQARWGIRRALSKSIIDQIRPPAFWNIGHPLNVLLFDVYRDVGHPPVLDTPTAIAEYLLEMET